MLFRSLLLVAAGLAASGSAFAALCTQVRGYEAPVTRSLDCEAAPSERRVLIGLRDDWTPAIFSETRERPQPYLGRCAAAAHADFAAARAAAQALLRSPSPGATTGTGRKDPATLRRRIDPSPRLAAHLMACWHPAYALQLPAGTVCAPPSNFRPAPTVMRQALLRL